MIKIWWYKRKFQFEMRVWYYYSNYTSQKKGGGSYLKYTFTIASYFRENFSYILVSSLIVSFKCFLSKGHNWKRNYSTILKWKFYHKALKIFCLVQFRNLTEKKWRCHIHIIGRIQSFFVFSQAFHPYFSLS